MVVHIAIINTDLEWALHPAVILSTVMEVTADMAVLPGDEEAEADIDSNC
jgi:hypothetical protein